MPYLLDADWAIQSLSGHGRAAATLQRLAAQRVVISVITLAELYEIAFNSPNPQAHLASVRQFLAPFRVVNLDEPIVERFAEIRAHLRRQGQLIEDFDILIAATALHYDLTLLTFNVRHFQRVSDLQIYTLS